MLPDFSPIKCAKRDREDVGTGGFDFWVMGHNLGHMLAAGQSSQVTEKDEQQLTAVSPKR